MIGGWEGAVCMITAGVGGAWMAGDGLSPMRGGGYSGLPAADHALSAHECLTSRPRRAALRQNELQIMGAAPERRY